MIEAICSYEMSVRALDDGILHSYSSETSNLTTKCGLRNGCDKEREGKGRKVGKKGQKMRRVGADVATLKT
jgi:hypothetical protein